MRSLPSLIGLVAAVALNSSHLSHANDADDWARLYAVRIDRATQQSSSGYGVYLGKGIFITAAHVAGLGILRRPLIGIGGQDFATRVVKDGHFHSVDLTLLSVEERDLPVSLALRRMPLCQILPFAGEPVVVAIPEGATRAKVISPALLPRDTPVELRTAITFNPASGTSGSGVFDANKKCLVGIITQKLSAHVIEDENGHAVTRQRDIARIFVPASKIAKFIPETVRY